MCVAVQPLAVVGFEWKRCSYRKGRARRRLCSCPECRFGIAVLAPRKPLIREEHGIEVRSKGRICHQGNGRYALSNGPRFHADRKSTRLNSSHLGISYAVFCLKKKK